MEDGINIASIERMHEMLRRHGLEAEFQELLDKLTVPAPAPTDTLRDAESWLSEMDALDHEALGTDDYVLHIVGKAREALRAATPSVQHQTNAVSSLVRGGSWAECSCGWVGLFHPEDEEGRVADDIRAHLAKVWAATPAPLADPSLPLQPFWTAAAPARPGPEPDTRSMSEILSDAKEREDNFNERMDHGSA